jgi:serine/threonine protein kinase
MLMLTSMALAQQRAFDPSAAEPIALDGYQIVDCLGEGGMGRLFRALDRASGETVALKLARSGTAAENAGLLREAAALKRLRHPGVVRLLDDGIWWGTPWLALELLEGRTLLEEMELWWTDQPSGDRPPQPMQAPRIDQRRMAAAGRLGEVAAIGAALADVLDHVHQAGFVHRDVKPANVFLRRGAERGRVALLDFGLACPPNAPRPADGRPSQCVGTMQYAAPEQIRGEPVDARADIYSLGCVLFELVTGRRPFEGDTEHEVAQRHLYRPPQPPADLVWGLPRKLDDLIVELLAKSPDARPRSAREVGERLTSANHSLLTAGFARNSGMWSTCSRI